MHIKNRNTGISLVILILSVLLSYYTLMPRSIVPSNAPETAFSAERAARHIKAMSKTIHPSGSPEIKLVKNYVTSQLTALGLEFQIQTDSAKSRYEANKNIELNNIIARIKGTGKGKALLILSHYDSAQYSYGAADDASGVASVLEAIRAHLSTGTKALNDIIILFTDGEEQGLLGAKLFANKHPWAQEVGFAINLEARGTAGPSFTLVETNNGNANMMALYTKAGLKYPLGTSLFYSIYKRMPNDGDSSVFREKLDIDGFLFAFIDEHHNYHRPSDNYEHTSLKSVQHQGFYLLPLIEVCANTDLAQIKTKNDVVFFNIPVIGMLQYSYGLILPALVLSIMFFIGLLFYGFHLNKLSWKAIGIGFLVFLLGLLLSGGIGYLGVKLFPDLNASRFPLYGHLYTLAFVLICMAIYMQLLAFGCRFEAKHTSYHVAPLLFWILLNIPIALYLKGAAYFIIPVFCALISLLLMLKTNKPTLLSTTVLAVPMLVILAPMIKFLPLAIGPRLILSSTLLITLIMGLLTGVLIQYAYKRKMSLSLLVLGLAVLGYIKIISS
ncbi:M20/M25/M40 family metallo-hydrolase [Algibacter mikhailovii]|uniref:M20/M25/M40 family metallo-hydrolase n=1 Tax=Algibacter mikhailovii TaxID=425498 RepID=UPI0024950901|nr:M20/M25/M40 family metallo-hydrolase [Algibacter mikhailovii]